MRRFPVEVPESVAKGEIGTNFVQTDEPDGQQGDDPILMLHGFDSSLLEFRRLLPKLGELGAEAYAVDVLGWGFTDLVSGEIKSFGAGAFCVPYLGQRTHHRERTPSPTYLIFVHDSTRLVLEVAAPELLYILLRVLGY